jgi:hypothetical protein
MGHTSVETGPRHGARSNSTFDRIGSRQTPHMLERSNGLNSESPAIGSAGTRLNRIARRAHEIYESRGGEHGKAVEDWLQAERDIDADIEREQSRETAEGSNRAGSNARRVVSNGPARAVIPADLPSRPQNTSDADVPDR